MTLGQTLIDKARDLMSMNRLASEIGENQANLRAMQAGRRKTPPHVAAKLARITGDDPRLTLLTAYVEQHEDQDERERLATLLGLDWRKRSLSNRIGRTLRRGVGKLMRLSLAKAC